MKCKRFSLTLFYSILLTFIGLISCKPIEKEIIKNPPNVILILTDDQGWGDLSLNGNSNLNMPNIDQLAQNGALFERFYVSPVCSPTRAEILTGRYHVRGGVYSTSKGGERLDLDEVTLADNFKENGYETAAFGKWHNGMQHPYHPNSRGFEEFYGFCSGHWGNYFDPLLEHNGQLIKGQGFLTDDLTQKAIQFIDKNKDKSFFVYIPYNTPHSPMQVPDKYWMKFKEKDIGVNYLYKNKKDLNHAKAAYAMCENIDWNVGRIRNKLKELQLEENTIVIYLSDNGPNGWRWNDELKGIKGSTDEGGVRSPMIIQWLNHIKAGKKIDQIASSIDLLPTLADLTGIKLLKSKPLDGKSLKPLLYEDKPNWGDRYVVSYWKGKTSIRSQQFRLDNDHNLFDMVQDPEQKENIALNYPEIVDEMMSFKVKWEKEVLSELPAEDYRAIPIAHPDFKHTQLPARDGKAHGNIKRSNRFPNCSFYTHWIEVNDKITWDVEVLSSGNFEAIVYYTCSQDNIGSTIELGMGENVIQQIITEAHNPPIRGMEYDRVPRYESYVKDFKPLNMGVLPLKKGKGTLQLRSLNIKGSEVMDFRLIMLRKIEI